MQEERRNNWNEEAEEEVLKRAELKKELEEVKQEIRNTSGVDFVKLDQLRAKQREINAQLAIL